MSSFDPQNLMRTVTRIKQSLFEDILPSVERRFEEAQNLTTHSLAGKGVDLINEAQTRQYVLDPILNSLGWNTNSPEQILVEAPAESDASGKHRRFLDYHGQEILESGVRGSLLILEAKRLSVAFPFDKSNSSAAKDQLINAIELSGTNSSSEEAIDAFWKDILKTAKDYVVRVTSSAAGCPKLFVLTNGNWFLIFKNPHKTFNENFLDPSDLSIFVDLDQVISRADEFYEHLSFEHLSTRIPEQHPADLRRFFSDDEFPLEVCFTVDLATNLLQIQPVFGMSIVAQVRKPNGNWIQFRCDEPGADKVIILHKTEKIGECMHELEHRAEALLAQLRNHGQLRIVTALEYEASIVERGVQQEFGFNSLFVKNGRGAYYIHIGNFRGLLLPTTEYDNCEFHAWGSCKSANAAVGSGPITGQSVDPPSYFPSGSPFHCAHRVVHSKRSDRCPILTAEAYMCCRKCALQDRCWPEGYNDLPCKSD